MGGAGIAPVWIPIPVAVRTHDDDEKAGTRHVVIRVDEIIAERLDVGEDGVEERSEICVRVQIIVGILQLDQRAVHVLKIIVPFVNGPARDRFREIIGRMLQLKQLAHRLVFFGVAKVGLVARVVIGFVRIDFELDRDIANPRNFRAEGDGAVPNQG